MSGAVSRLAEEPRPLTLDEGAAQLGITVDEFNFHLLLGRLPEPIDGLWPAETLILKLRGAGTETKYRSGVYVIQFMDFIKIGFSNKMLQRLAGIQDSLPLRIKIHQIIDGKTRRGERSLHRRFAQQYRARGEWFKLEGRLAAWIEGGCK